MIKRFRKVSDGIYRGSAPSVEDVVFLNQKLGVKKIISLDFSAGKHIDRVCTLLNIEHVMIPIDVFYKSTLLRLVKRDIVELFEKGKPTFVHCIEGKDRTGLAVAMFRGKHDGWSYEAAIKEAKSLDFGIGLNPEIVNLYEKIIKMCCKSKKSEDGNNATDITLNGRESEGEYRDYTLDSAEQQSWSPYTDYRVRRYPNSDTELYYDEPYKARNDQDSYDGPTGMHISDQTIPQAGIYDQNTSGINGAGPSMIGSGIMP